jgi:hypothetical protein
MRDFLGPPEHRYANDPTYKAVVDSLEALIHRAELTPGEIREAAMYACIRYELRNMSAMRRFVVKAGAPLGAGAYMHAREELDRAEDRMRALREWLDAHPLPDPHR